MTGSAGQQPMAAGTSAPPMAAGAPSAAGSSGSAADGGSTAPSCPSPIAVDDLLQRREMCTFAPGALAHESLGISSEQQAGLPVRHVIVMMKENRSYDHYLGQLHSQGQPDSEAMPANFSNLDLQNRQVMPFHLTTTCLHMDPGHQWQDMHAQVNGGAMDGFVTNAASSTLSDGHFAMGYYDNSEIPFYYFLANTFALADRHFASVRSGTAPNRAYLLLATSDGVRQSNAGYPRPEVPSLFTRLDEKGVSWAAYTDAVPFEGALNWPANHAGVHTIAELKRALADASLPAVSFVDSKEDVEDEHPTADIQVGEAWTYDIYQAVIASPLWSSLALILTYDEAGGFADHVPPPNACVASSSEAMFNELGARVPTIVISPWARAHFVSHVVRDHSAILRFIETVFDLPALTARDANSDALLDMFDFACPPQPSPAAAPAPGTGGCH
jgi:phospholipase C